MLFKINKIASYRQPWALFIGLLQNPAARLTIPRAAYILHRERRFPTSASPFCPLGSRRILCSLAQSPPKQRVFPRFSSHPLQYSRFNCSPVELFILFYPEQPFVSLGVHRSGGLVLKRFEGVNIADCFSRMSRQDSKEIFWKKRMNGVLFNWTTEMMEDVFRHNYEFVVQIDSSFIWQSATRKL